MMAQRAVALVHDGGVVARLASVALGIWLLASSLVLPRTSPAGFNVAVTGLLVVLCAGCAVWAPAFRFGTMALAVWLVATELLVFSSPLPTELHDVAVGIALFALSVISSSPKLVDPTRPAVHEGFLD
jgi:hypothetical protein